MDKQLQTIADDTRETVKVSEVAWDVETDIVVAGGGAAGLTAVLAASEADVRVTLLEKEPQFGGTGRISSGWVPAAGTRLQEAAGIDDSGEKFADDILKMNGHEAEALSRRLAGASADLIHWLIDRWDVEWHLHDDFNYPGHSEYRYHSVEGKGGAEMIAQFQARAEAAENVEMLTDTPVRKVVEDDGDVVGVIAGKERTEAIRGEAVVLATDGFPGNRRMLVEWCESAADAIYTGADGNTGDGIRWGAELGAELRYMDSFQAYATQAMNGIKSPYGIQMNGGIVVDEAGRRLGNEALGPADFAADVLNRADESAFEIFDGRIYDMLAENNKGAVTKFQKAVEHGTYSRAETVEELAAELGCDPEGTRRTVAAYNEAVENDEPDEVGRTAFRHTLEPPFYGGRVQAAIEVTQGGLAVDTDARVLRTDGSIIEGLYAAGGSAMGISGHGNTGYLPGNGLTAALGLGRIAGRSARKAVDCEAAVPSD